MKTKITKKQINESGTSFVGDIQTLLRYQKPQYYNCGAYGWNWDCYVFYTTGHKVYFVLNGYRNFPSNRVYKDYDFVRGYEEQARAVQKDFSLFNSRSYDEAKEKINALLKEFLQKIFNDDTILVY